MIVLTAEQASHLLYRDQFPDAQLRPLALSDGRYGVPDRVLKDPRHAWAHAVLRQGVVVADNTVTVGNPATDPDSVLDVPVNGKSMHVGFASGFDPTRAWPFPHRRPFEMVSPNLFRFEARYNNDHLSYDWHNNRRRVEIAQPDSTGPKMGDTWWTAWSNIWTDNRKALLDDNRTLIHQWFHTGKGPFVYVAVGGGNLEIATQSPSTPYKAHYHAPFDPPTGTPQHFVMKGVLGQTGHLDVWLNGTQIVNVATPIGYYDLPKPDDPAYLHIASGIYQGNVVEPAVLYLANLEFGTTDLSARVTTPTPVAAPAGGWV